MLLRLTGKRGMGQNDPPHTDDLSVTRTNKNEIVTVNRSAWWGHNQPLPHRRIICNAVIYNPSGHRVHVDIYPANAVAGLYISRSQTQITKRKEANRRAQIGCQSKKSILEESLLNENKDTLKENVITRRIGSTTYKLKVFFSETAKETMEDKILRMIKNEVSTNGEKCGIIESPQVSRPA